MKQRLVALLLALLLPLQLSWAAVGEYCQHESAPKAADHLGHHAHVHKDDASKASGKGSIDSDCGFCHATTSATLAVVAPAVPEPAVTSQLVAVTHAAHPSALARAPDRPQWLRLA